METDTGTSPKRIQLSGLVGEANNKLYEIREAFGSFLNPPWYRMRPTPSQIAAFCDEIAIRKTNLIRQMVQEYPAAADGAWTVTSTGLIFQPEPATAPQPDSEDRVD